MTVSLRALVVSFALLAVACGMASGPMNQGGGSATAGGAAVAGGAGGGESAGGAAGGAAQGGGTVQAGGSATAGGAAGGSTELFTDAGCRVASFEGGRLLDVRYSLSMNGNPPMHYGATGLQSRTGMGVDALGVEFWWYLNQAGTVLPYRTQLTGTAGLNQCNLCVTIGEGCSSPTRCQKTYLARSGAFQLLVADRSTDAGALVMEGQNVTFQEWLRANDSPAPDGGCVVVPAFSIAGTWAGNRIDAGVAFDAGVPMRDPCATSSALSTLGCNGGFRSGDPAPNTHSGSCMNDNGLPQGTCTSGELFCSAPRGSNLGRCIQYCPVGTSPFTTGNCNQGYRCARISGASFGICYRDCDATHPCPSDQTCDSEGSCVD